MHISDSRELIFESYNWNATQSLRIIYKFELIFHNLDSFKSRQINMAVMLIITTSISDLIKIPEKDLLF